MSKDKWINAGDLMEKLARDPAHQARVAARAAEEAEWKRRWAIEQRDLVQELSEAGISVESAWDLVAMKEPYPAAVPILTRHLSRQYSSRVKEGIVRALTCKEARGKSNRALIKAFKEEANDQLRWTIGNAIFGTATVDDIPAVLELLMSKRDYGESRDMLVHAIARLMGNKSESILVSLLDDDDLTSSSLIALGRLKITGAVEHIRPFLNHENSEIRKQAKVALRKMGAS